MLCNKIEINKSERFSQTIEIEINKSDCFTQTRMSILVYKDQHSHILALLSESYIQEKTCRRSCYTDLHRIEKFILFLPTRK